MHELVWNQKCGRRLGEAHAQLADAGLGGAAGWAEQVKERRRRRAVGFEDKMFHGHGADGKIGQLTGAEAGDGGSVLRFELPIALQRGDARPLAPAGDAWPQSEHRVTARGGRLAPLLEHGFALHDFGAVFAALGVAAVFNHAHGRDDVSDKLGAWPEQGVGPVGNLDGHGAQGGGGLAIKHPRPRRLVGFAVEHRMPAGEAKPRRRAADEPSLDWICQRIRQFIDDVLACWQLDDAHAVGSPEVLGTFERLIEAARDEQI